MSTSSLLVKINKIIFSVHRIVDMAEIRVSTVSTGTTSYGKHVTQVVSLAKLSSNHLTLSAGVLWDWNGHRK